MYSGIHSGPKENRPLMLSRGRRQKKSSRVKIRGGLRFSGLIPLVLSRQFNVPLLRRTRKGIVQLSQNTLSMSEFDELSNTLGNKIVPPSGCWRDFNVDHRAWVKLNRLAKIRSFFLDAEDVPDEPDPSDYPNLEPDCE